LVWLQGLSTSEWLGIKQLEPFRYQRKLIGQERTRLYLRLHLRFLCDLRSSSTVLPSSISHAIDYRSRPIRENTELDSWASSGFI